MASIEPKKEDLFAVAEKSGLDKKEVVEIFDEMTKLSGV